MWWPWSGLRWMARVADPWHMCQLWPTTQSNPVSLSCFWCVHIVDLLVQMYYVCYFVMHNLYIFIVTSLSYTLPWTVLWRIYSLLFSCTYHLCRTVLLGTRDMKNNFLKKILFGFERPSLFQQILCNNRVTHFIIHCNKRVEQHFIILCKNRVQPTFHNTF